MANKIGLNLNGVKELKLGKSFNKGPKDEAYHTLRYDFKPASVDSQKSGSFQVEGKEVTLSVPLCSAGLGPAQPAVFKGSKTPASKDCVLIIDNATGELVLERIADNIRVKKHRLESLSRKGLVPSNSEMRKPSPPQPSRKGANPPPKNHVPPNSSTNSMPSIFDADHKPESGSGGGLSDVSSSSSSSSSDGHSDDSDDSDSDDSEDNTAQHQHKHHSKHNGTGSDVGPTTPSQGSRLPHKKSVVMSDLQLSEDEDDS